MLIRPQNKRGLINFDMAFDLYISIDYINNKPYRWNVMLNMGLTQEELGTYSTEERALNTIIGVEGTYLSSTAIISNGDIFNPAQGYVPVARVYDMPPDEDQEEVEED